MNRLTRLLSLVALLLSAAALTVSLKSPGPAHTMAPRGTADPVQYAPPTSVIQPTVQSVFGLATSAQQAVWAAQATWYVNAGTGSDANDGTAAHPLKSIAEFNRRLPYVRGQYTVWIEADDPTEQNITINGDRSPTAPVWVQFQGAVKTPLHTGNVTTSVPSNPATKQDATIIDSGLASWAPYVGKVIRFGAGAEAVVIADLGGLAGAKKARISEPITWPFLGVPQAVVAPDTYTVLDLYKLGHTTIHGSAEIDFQELSMGPVGDVHGVDCDSDVSFFESCTFSGFDSTLAANTGVINTYTTANMRGENFADLQITGGGVGGLVIARSGAAVNVQNVSALGYEVDPLGLIECSGGYAAAFDGAAANALVVDPGGLFVMAVLGDSQRFWGKGFTGTAVDVRGGGTFVYDPAVLPGVTTSGDEVHVGGTVKTFAAITATSGFVNANNAAAVVPR